MHFSGRGRFHGMGFFTQRSLPLLSSCLDLSYLTGRRRILWTWFSFRVSSFRVSGFQGLGFRVFQGFRVSGFQGLGFQGFQVSVSGFRVSSFKFQGFKFQGFRFVLSFRVSSLVSGFQVLGFRV